jgi:hypothetical protein
MVSTPCPLLVPTWILHDVNHGFELFLPLPDSPALCPPGACQAGGWPGRPVGPGGLLPAPAGVRSTDSAMDSVFLLPGPLPTRPGRAAPCSPSLAILGVARGCGCFLWLCVFVVRVLKKGKLRLQVGKVKVWGISPIPHCTHPLVIESPLLPASAVN